MADSSSDLFELKNYFLLGNYQAAINEGNALTDIEDKVERDIYIFRSEIALGNWQNVLDEIKEDASRGLKAVRLMALYVGQPQKKEQVLNEIRDMLADSVASKTTLSIILSWSSTISYGSQIFFGMCSKDDHFEIL